MMKRIIRNPKLYIILLLAFTAVVLWIRVHNREPLYDEVVYYFKLTKEHPFLYEYYLNPQINTIEDVFSSQIVHYKYVNGRSLIHFVEQMFSGVYSTELFKIINVLGFVGLVYGLMVLCVSTKKRLNILLWFITVAVLMYMFPETYDIWTSINLTPNYLYPALLYTIIFILWQRIREGRYINQRWLPIVGFIAFVAGWSHEGFSVPVSGAMVVYYLCNFRQLRGDVLWIVIPVWLGSLIVIISPGLLLRNELQQEFNPVSRLLDSFNFLRGMQVVRIYVAIMCVYALFKPRQAIARMYNDRIYIYILFFATIVIFIAHAGFRSMMVGDLVCFIMLFKWIARNKIWEHNSRIQCVISSAIVFLYAGHQVLIAHDVSTQYYYIRSLIEDLKVSQCGVIEFEDKTYSSLTDKYVQKMDERIGKYIPRNSSIDLSKYDVKSTIQVLNDCFDIPFYPLSKGDYNAVVNPDKFFIDENKVPGDTRMYYAGGHFMWFKPGTPMDSLNVKVTYEPLTWRDGESNFYKLLYLISPPAHNEPQGVDVETIETCYGTSYRVWFDNKRKVVSAYRQM